MGLAKSKVSNFFKQNSSLKQSKSSKKEKKRASTLNSSDLNKLMSITKFTIEECMEWHEKFCVETNGRGVFDKKTFIKFFTQLNPEFKDADEFAANVFECNYKKKK
jgi:hypothetical protein